MKVWAIRYDDDKVADAYVTVYNNFSSISTLLGAKLFYSKKEAENFMRFLTHNKEKYKIVKIEIWEY